MSDLIGSYDPVRRPWVVQVIEISPTTQQEVVTATYTPDSPGPLVGVWTLTLGPLRDARYGQVTTNSRPGWRPDQTRLRIWEQPDTAQDPDFSGVVGIITGGRTPEGTTYTVPLQGRYDLIAEAPIDDVSFYGGVVRAGVEALPFRRGETVDEYHKRLLAPYPDGTVGYQADGTLVMGRPIATESGVPVRPVSLAAADAQEIEDGMAERVDVITDVIASPGPRWAALRVKRTVPSGRRKLATVVDDRMKTAKVDVPAPVGFFGIFRKAWGQAEQLGAVLSSPPQASISTQQQLPDSQTLRGNAAPTADEVPRATLRVRAELPLSDIVRGSASSALAVNALYDLHTLTTGMAFWFVQDGNPADLPAGYDLLGESLANYGQVSVRQWLAVGAQEWEQTTDAQRLGSPAVYTMQARDAAQRAKVSALVEEENLREVFMSIGGGTYTYVMEATYTFPAAYRWGRRRAGVNPADVPDEYIRFYRSGTALAQVTPPTMNVDRLVDSIPAVLLPPGWDAVNSTSPSAQGRYPGIVRPPARVTGLSAGALPMTELRYERTHEALSTSWQAGARAVQVLSAAEEKARRSTVGKV